MKATLELELDKQQGSLERVLRVTRHRGFTLEQMQVLSNDNGRSFCVELTINSERRLSLLTNQLNKLFDVKALKIMDEWSYAQTA